MCTPFLEDNHIYGICSYGQLKCLRANTGERLWETMRATTRDGAETRWANAFLVKNAGRFFISNELGELIIARLTPGGYDEVARTTLIEPLNRDRGAPSSGHTPLSPTAASTRGMTGRSSVPRSPKK